MSYGPVQVLFGVDLDVAPGEIVALLGTNGAGKSTLLKAVCGLLRPSSGTVRMGGGRVPASPDRAARAGISLMPGGRGVFPTLTVTDNLRLAGWLRRHDRRAQAAAREEVLELFPALRRRLGTLAGNLSGGEQQMLALAQSLMGHPRLLMIDELSLGLAPSVVGQLLDVVRSIHESGVTIVVVEQSVNVALELAQRAVFMEKGEVRFAGATVDLLERPDILRSVFVAGAAQREVWATTNTPPAPSPAVPVPPAAEAAAPPATAAPAGPAGPARARLEAHNAPYRAVSLQPAVLECRGVTKRFGGITAVDGVDLDVAPGRILGLIGQNGAGKTTLLDCISGFLPLEGGRIVFRGRDVTDWVPHERARARLGRSFQEALLFPSLTVSETVAVALERHAQTRSLVADALRQPASYESELRIAARVVELVDLCGLGAFADKLTGELSTGTRRIVELACILGQEPVALLLDEPSAGVAQRETEALGPLLKRVGAHTGAAMVVIEHDMPLLASICDEMVALELGRVIARGRPAEVLADPRVVESYLGTNSAAVNRSGPLAGA